MNVKTAVQQARANTRSGEKTFQWFVATLLTVGGLLMVLPFAWMILSSFKTEGEVTQIPRPSGRSILHWIILNYYSIAWLLEPI